jgi:hypothetical protein
MSEQCPLYPRKQTLVERTGMSALCQSETHALQQKRLLNDVIGDLLQMHWHVEA